MLDCLTSGFIDQSKARVTLLILDPCTVLLIFDPVLSLIPGIGQSENNLTISDGKRVIGISFCIDPHSWLIRDLTTTTLMAVMPKRWEMMRLMRCLMRNVLDRRVGLETIQLLW